MTHQHHGIPCMLADRPLCSAITTVLRQIQRRVPADYARLRRRVERIEAVPVADAEDGTQGEWRSLRGTRFGEEHDTPGTLRLLPGIDHPLATVAHEFGHVCTREADFTRRDGYSGEWANEMCADLYAYRWGFGRAIARDRPTRVFGHHGPGPRSIFTEEHDGVVHRFRVTRAFYIHLMQIETPEGVVIETVADVQARRHREQAEWDAAHPEVTASLRALGRRPHAAARKARDADGSALSP